MELILVRHPRPLAADGICYGRSDLAVAPDELARVHAALLKTPLPADVPVFSSPLQRCAGLAALLSPQVRFDANLMEMDFGAWERRSWSDIPRAEVDAWAADLLHYRPGGGETVLKVAQRVRAAMDVMLGGAHPQAIVICHAGTIRLFATLAQGMPLHEAALAAAAAPHRIGYGEVLRVVMHAARTP